MGPIALSVLTAIGLKLWEQRQAKAAAAALPEPVQFRPEQTAKFSYVAGKARYFKRAVADANILPGLDLRSAVPEGGGGELQRVGRVWRVVPLQHGLLSAGDVVRQAREEGQVVLGSLSLVLMPIGSAAAMLLVVGPPGTEQFAEARSPFAVIDAPQPTASPTANGSGNGRRAAPPAEVPAAVVVADEKSER